MDDQEQPPDSAMSEGATERQRGTPGTGPPRVLIAGGYGVFGRVFAREVLASLPVRVAIAGRDAGRLAKACRALRAGDRVEPRVLDLHDRRAVAHASEDCFAVACAAGPFQTLDRELPRVVAEAGAHWLDISDVTEWVLAILADRALHEKALENGTAVIPGLSSVPALSGVLVRWARNRLVNPRRARVVLYIGNRNAKGPAAIESARMSGFGDPLLVDLPAGRRLAYRFASPDDVLLRQDLGLEAEFRVALQWSFANRIMAWLQRRPGPARSPARTGLARVLSALAAPFSVFGSEISSLQAEVFGASGEYARAVLTGLGQRLAVLPCVLALEALADGGLRERGCINPAAWLGPDDWASRLSARGIRFDGHA